MTWIARRSGNGSQSSDTPPGVNHRCSHSGFRIAVALLSEQMEAILAGTVEGFELFGCVPWEVWWGNPTTVATTILDRFLHHAEILTITGHSCRLKDKAAKDSEEPRSRQRMNRTKTQNHSLDRVRPVWPAWSAAAGFRRACVGPILARPLIQAIQRCARRQSCDSTPENYFARRRQNTYELKEDTGRV